MEAGLLQLPGLTQFRTNLCCLACGLKDAGINECFVRGLVLNIITVDQVATGRDQFSKNMIDLMTPLQQKTVYAVCDSLIEVQGQHYARVVHPYYFLRAKLPVSFCYKDYKFQIGEIKRGQVLEIFQPTESSFFASNVLIPLQKESMINDEKRYADLPEKHYNRCIWISLKTSTVTVSTPSETGNDIADFLLQSGAGNLGRLFEELHDILINIDR